MNQMQYQVQPLTPMVKKILFLTVGIWIVGQVILEGFLNVRLSAFFALFPAKVLYEFFVWQPFSYMLLHSLDWTHIVFNMLMLWWVGGELEARWGGRFFLTYYIVCGVGAGFLYCLGAWIWALLGGSTDVLLIPVVGASGALFGLLLAYGILFGERTMLFMMLFPMKAKYFVLILGGVQLISLMTKGMAGGDVAYLAHLSGIVVGYLFLRLRGQIAGRQASKKRGRNLRLVVDNEKSESRGPRYWN